MNEIKLQQRYPNSRHEDITDAFVRGYEAGYNDSSVHYELEHCPSCKNVADLQEALDFISLIDGMIYCIEENDKYETDLITGDEYVLGCEECPLIDNEGGCLLGERMKQYYEWKGQHEISLR